MSVIKEANTPDNGSSTTNGREDACKVSVYTSSQEEPLVSNYLTLIICILSRDRVCLRSQSSCEDDSLSLYFKKIETLENTQRMSSNKSPPALYRSAI